VVYKAGDAAVNNRFLGSDDGSQSMGKECHSAKEWVKHDDGSQNIGEECHSTEEWVTYMGEVQEGGNSKDAGLRWLVNPSHESEQFDRCPAT